ncbi:MAG: hypothetical protein HC907_33590 [Richelia sp. SM1_7_0]|nr:hypothetical protein [Richelia sp. SM1_7_0]
MTNNTTSGFDKLMWADDQLIGLYNLAQRTKFLLSGGSKKRGMERNKRT